MPITSLPTPTSTAGLSRGLVCKTGGCRPFYSSQSCNFSSAGKTLRHVRWINIQNTAFWKKGIESSLGRVSTEMTDNHQGRGFCYNRDTDFSRVRDPDRSQMAERRESEVSTLSARRVDLAPLHPAEPSHWYDLQYRLSVLRD